MSISAAALEEVAMNFSPEPRVQLVNAFNEPYNNAVATARSCYTRRLMTPAEMAKDEEACQKRDHIAASIYQAGHHTTLQHATFQFSLENVSRQFIWSFLHAHPFYNSDQVSQRYVEVRPEAVLKPRLAPKLLAIYEQAVARQMEAYQKITALLEPLCAEEVLRIFPARRKKSGEYKNLFKKKAQEVARYVLPVGTLAHLYHTISGLTLHRYHRLSEWLELPTETSVVIKQMVAAVNLHDPLFFARVEDPLPLTATPEYALLEQLFGSGKGAFKLNQDALTFKQEFDADLNTIAGAAGATDSPGVQLQGYLPEAPALLARAVRTVLGLPQAKLSDQEALELVLSPAKNHYLGEILNLTTLTKLSRVLAHVQYTFKKKISHTADSQDQRHRVIMGSRPLLYLHYTSGTPDIVLPALLRLSEPQAVESLELLQQTMQSTWESIDQLLDAGVEPEWAFYLLPNATAIRFMASGDLLGLYHKWTTRLCYNTQEELWRLTAAEVAAVRKVHPEIGRYLGPPCAKRHMARQKPACPEGERFCGVPVWQLAFNDYQRVL